MSTSQDTSQGTCDGCRSLSFEGLNRGVIHHPTGFLCQARIRERERLSSVRTHLGYHQRLQLSRKSRHCFSRKRERQEGHPAAALQTPPGRAEVMSTLLVASSSSEKSDTDEGDRSQSSLAAYRLSKLNQARSLLGVGIDRLRHKCEGVFSLRAVPGMDLSPGVKGLR
jgi:hypothetical protein